MLLGTFTCAVTFNLYNSKNQLILFPGRIDEDSAIEVAFSGSQVAVTKQILGLRSRSKVLASPLILKTTTDFNSRSQVLFLYLFRTYVALEYLEV